jgi:hypothetical protein
MTFNKVKGFIESERKLFCLILEFSAEMTDFVGMRLADLISVCLINFFP